MQAVLPALRAAGGTVVDISSDAAVEAYAGWGGYGASKAALDQLTAVLAVENPELRVYAVDPGDMATDMHQAAFPGEDISDRPAPETVVPVAAGPARRRPAQRPLPRRRPRSGGGLRMIPTFILPAGSEATAPPEWRGLQRDEVRLMAVRPDGTRPWPASATCPSLLEPGDLVVVNTSATLPGRLPARRADGVPVPLHWSTTLDDGDWVVEIRRPDNSGPDLGVEPGTAAGSPRRRPDHAPRRLPRPRSALSAVARPDHPGRRRDRATCPDTARRSSTATCEGSFDARRLPERLRHRAPAARRWPAPAGRSPSGCWSRSWPAACPSSR